MADLPLEPVRRLLEAVGLVGPAFDPAAVAADLQAAMDSAATLDDLLGDDSVPDPTSFDPRWL